MVKLRPETLTGVYTPSTGRPGGVGQENGGGDGEEGGGGGDEGLC